jgi:23S rRNA (pseudouridine1915-N3)-methyltransferase
VKIVLLQIGKTTESYLREGIQVYENRINNYISFEFKTLPELKNAASLSFDQQKNLEGKMILEAIPPSAFIVLLDEAGKEFTSVEFSGFIQKQLLRSIKCMIFVIGGPYGFSESVYKKADAKIALSKMTFSHQMVRLIFMEQLYRAMTILKNEPYHH